MTTRPRLYTSGSQVVGLVAFALFAVLAAVFVTAEFGEAAGFGGKPITATIGYAMFSLDAGALPSEGFLVAFEIIDVVLVAALAGAVMLAKREGELPFPLSDGGEPSEARRTSSEERSESDGGREADRREASGRASGETASREAERSEASDGASSENEAGGDR